MTYNELWRQLVQIYDEGEAKAIARMVYEERFGLTLSDIYLGRETQLSAADQTELEEIAKRLLQGEPIQYVLGQADFCGRTFMVNEHVLIPRPETEELCNWKPLPLPSPKGEGAKILDIGTGSGCIAITLAAMYPEAQVIGWDISEDALEVAKTNAIRNNVNVSFEQVDVLNLPSPLPFGGGRGRPFPSLSAILLIYATRNVPRWQLTCWSTNRIRPSLYPTTTPCCSIGLLPSLDRQH